MAKIIGRTVTTPPPKKLSKYENDKSYVTNEELESKGYAKQSEIPTDYAKENHTHDLSAYAQKTELPTKTSQLTNDSGFITEELVDDKLSKLSTGGVSSWNDLTDKPFDKTVEDITVFEEQTQTFEYDGESYGCQIIIDEAIYSKWTANWNEAKVVWDGVEYNIVSKYSYGMKIVGNSLLFDGVESSEPFGIICAEQDGTYMCIVICYTDETPTDTENAPTINHTFSVNASVENIQYLSHEYIKDMYYSEEIEETTLIENETVTLSSSIDGSSGFNQYESELFTITENIPYQVVFDDTTYECVGTIITTQGVSIPYIGNPYYGGLFAEMTLEDNGMPFCIFNYNGITIIVGVLDSEHTFSVSMGGEFVQKIPTKYIPTDYIKELIDEVIDEALNSEV